MALNPHLSDTAASAAANAIAPLANSGKLELYSGTQPANANTAPASPPTNVLLATLTMAATAFPGGATGGVLTAGTITSGTAIATGTAAWWRLYESDAATALIDGSVGTGVNYNLVMNSAAIVTGATVAVSAMTVTITE